MIDTDQLDRLRRERAEARTEVARIQTALDELGDHAPADQASRLEAERVRALQRCRQAEAALRAADGDAAQLERQRAGEGLQRALDGIQQRVQTMATEQAALVCAPHRQAADQAGTDSSALARAHLAGAKACDTAQAHAGCRYAAAEWCPRARAAQLYATIDQHLRTSRIPARQQRLLAGHFSRTHRQPLDPRAFDAFAVAEAVYSRRPATVPTLAGPVVLRGDETILVYYGPTGRGKTLAACYLIARWGGLYVTAYELAGVGQDPLLPSRAQLAQAPVLVIDQVGRQHRGATDYAAQVLEAVVDQRYAEEKLTVIVGNYASRQQLEDDTDEIVASRLAEVGVCVQCYGEDARRAPPGSPDAGRR